MGPCSLIASSLSLCVVPCLETVGGTQVKLGGNRGKGSRRMYFCLVHSIAMPPSLASAHPGVDPVLTAGAVSPLVPAYRAPFAGEDAPLPTGSSRGGDTWSNIGSEVSVGRTTSDTEVEDPGGVLVESKRDQVFNFWDEEVNGKLEQAPLDFDWQGRGWCKVGYTIRCSQLPCVWSAGASSRGQLYITRGVPLGVSETIFDNPRL